MKKNQLSKEPINLMPYRLKSEDSLDHISARHPYKPRFVYELLSSPDNSFSEMIKDFRSKGHDKEFRRVAFNDQDFEGPSSIHPDHERNKPHPSEQPKMNTEIRNILIRNEELVSEVEGLQEILRNVESGSEGLEKEVRRLTSEAKAERQRSYSLSQRVEGLLEQNSTLKEEICILESNLRKLKENRNAAPAKSQHQSIKESKEIYDRIGGYLKNRVQKLLFDIKKIAMPPKLQKVLEDFLEEILLLNQFTVGKQRAKKPVEEIEESPKLPFSVQRLRLDKSIQKLKQIQRDLQKDQRSMSKSIMKPPMSNSLGVVWYGASRDRSRSKSNNNRRRIFN